jgi:hypothetical protein
MERSVPETSRPRAEPEIIPPGEADLHSRRGARAAFEGRGTQRIYVARVGPFGFAMAALAVALLAAAVFLLVLGAFVILIPLAGLVLAAAVLFGLFRGSFRH